MDRTLQQYVSEALRESRKEWVRLPEGRGSEDLSDFMARVAILAMWNWLEKRCVEAVDEEG